MNKVITTLKLGRNAHTITKRDRFLNNGLCVQLVKEIPLKVRFGAKDTMTLTEEDIKHLEKFGQITHCKHEYSCHGHTCRVFSLVHPDEKFFVMGYESQEDVDKKQGQFLASNGYYKNAIELKSQNEGHFHLVKIFDSEQEEVDY